MPMGRLVFVSPCERAWMMWFYLIVPGTQRGWMGKNHIDVENII